MSDWGDDCIKCFLPETGVMRKLIRIPGVRNVLRAHALYVRVVRSEGTSIHR